MWTAILGALGSIGKLFDFLKFWQTKKAGRTEARLDAAERELERAKERQRIDGEVGDLDPDALERGLRDSSHS